MIGIVGDILRVWQRWWSLERIGRKEGLVKDLSAYPSLDVLDVRWGRQVDWVAVRIHPGIRSATIDVVSFRTHGTGDLYSRAGRHSRTRLLAADGEPSASVWLLDDLQHSTEVAILLNHCTFVSRLNERGDGGSSHLDEPSTRPLQRDGVWQLES